MKSIIKNLSFLLLVVTLVFTSCETEETLNITSPDPEFVLNTPGISTVFLNFALPDNPAFTISWTDEVTGSSNYTVEMSTDADFTSPTVLGTSDSNNFSMTVSEFNNALASIVDTQFKDIPVYMRVQAGDQLSNSILLLATTYPVNPPTLINPTDTDAFILSINSSDEIIMTVEWSDAVLSSSLGIDLAYTVEASAAGTNFDSPVIIGTANNATSVSLTHSDLNGVALGLGINAESAGNIDMRVIARNTNANGNTLERVTETTTVSVTPYSVSFPYLYLVGDATTPGWNPDNNNTAIFRDQNVPNVYFYTGYFNAGAFKLLETTAWQPQWGTNDGSTLAVNPGGGNDPGTFNVSTAGYYTYTFTTVGEGGSFTVAPYDASSAATYTTIGIIGDATPLGWGTDTDFTQDPNDPHIWHLDNVTLTNGGQILIRANDVWPPDGNAAVWRYTGSEELYGTARLDNGGGDNIPFNEPTGSYDIWFNDLDGSYVIIPN
ncbi:protein of unknown function [Hyunsoonleella jejuensis]|uniref:SusE outer membrane protein domain-containing protein n=1 Tax=Hyunsoonleella jejuensis TaxID=419940 RepID=A0A1H9L2J4_9FLAO|nr:SusE domain-containing protein [Hyunsoonleella jejuensis]SER05711.1 protein of unknown function [Hyunsoonleella jejuensis]